MYHCGIHSRVGATESGIAAHPGQGKKTLSRRALPTIEYRLLRPLHGDKQNIPWKANEVRSSPTAPQIQSDLWRAEIWCYPRLRHVIGSFHTLDKHMVSGSCDKKK